jgi:predicted NBD/HSP70 family sugar kinase
VAGGMRGEHMRRANLSALLRHVHAAPRTRSQLSEATGLTRTAIASLVSTLVDAGLVVEADSAARNGPGRPSPVVSGSPTKVVLAVEIAPDSLAVGVVALGGVVLHIERLIEPQVGRGPHDAVASVRALADRAIAIAASTSRHLAPATNASGLDVVGMGVAVAGVVARAAGRVLVAPNLGWRDVALGETVASAFGRRWPVAVANEADLGMLAEWGRGAAVGREHVVYISGEAGVGGGVLVAGVPLRGAAGFAGELGHLPVNPDGARCRCGARGCWETEIGEAAILRRAGQRRPRKGRATDALLDRARRGDPTARAALEVTGRWLGTGIAGLVNIFDPELIVLGGFFAQAFDHFDDAIVDELETRSLTGTRPVVDVVSAALGIDATLIGAAELGFEPILDDPLGANLTRS